MRGQVHNMKKFGQLVVKARYVILIISILLLIPAAFGYVNTRVNYDLLYYLPDGIDTMTGQDIMLNDFGSGAFGLVLVDGMDDENTAKLGFDMIIKSQYLYDYNFLHAFVKLFFDLYGYRYNVNTPYLFLDLHREFILEALKSHLVYIKRRYIK